MNIESADRICQHTARNKNTTQSAGSDPDEMDPDEYDEYFQEPSDKA